MSIDTFFIGPGENYGLPGELREVPAVVMQGENYGLPGELREVPAVVMQQ
jgi:hypothetical protein